MTYAEFWSYYSSDLTRQLVEHFVVVSVAATVGTILGLGASLCAYRNTRWSELALKASSTLMTMPSMALYVLLLSLFGLGWPPVLVALTLYSLRPIVQNSIVGLQGVDKSLVEAARGIGMNRGQCLRRVELPLAWPVILTGIRVGTTLLVVTATIGTIVNGPGLGNAIYIGLRNIGNQTALYFVLSGLVGVIVVGLTLNLALGLLGRLTTMPRIHRG